LFQNSVQNEFALKVVKKFPQSLPVPGVHNDTKCFAEFAQIATHLTLSAVDMINDFINSGVDHCIGGPRLPKSGVDQSISPHLCLRHCFFLLALLLPFFLLSFHPITLFSAAVSSYSIFPFDRRPDL
jgi:hypothetical protein